MAPDALFVWVIRNTINFHFLAVQRPEHQILALWNEYWISDWVVSPTSEFQLWGLSGLHPISGLSQSPSCKQGGEWYSVPVLDKALCLVLLLIILWLFCIMLTSRRINPNTFILGIITHDFPAWASAFRRASAHRGGETWTPTVHAWDRLCLKWGGGVQNN